MSNTQKVFDELDENKVVPNSLTYIVLLGGLLWERELMCKLWEKKSDEEELFTRNGLILWAILTVVHDYWLRSRP